jgi:hypothetical protein
MGDEDAMTETLLTPALSAARRQPSAVATSVLDARALLITAPAEPDSWGTRLSELRALRGLEDDWDGQGAKAPPVELVDSALELALLLRRRGVNAPCRVVPGVNGAVILEWQGGGAYCEIEVVRPYHAEAMRMVPGRPAEHWVFTG